MISPAHREMLLDAGVPLLIAETLSAAAKHRHIRLKEAAVEMALADYWQRQLAWTLRHVIAPLRIQMRPIFEAAGDGRKSGPTGGLSLEDAIDRLTNYPDDPMAIAVINAAVESSLVAGAEQTIRDMDAATAGIRFDLKNQAAQDYLANHAYEVFGKDIDATTAKMVGEIITEGFESGWNYKQIADAVTAQFEEFTAYNPLQYVRNRAELISITELGNAYSEGTLQSAIALDDAGIDMDKFWLTGGGDTCVKICQPNEDAGWLDVNADFPSGHQRPTGHPGCRCTMLTRRRQHAAAA